MACAHNIFISATSLLYHLYRPLIGPATATTTIKKSIHTQYCKIKVHFSVADSLCFFHYIPGCVCSSLCVCVCAFFLFLRKISKYFNNRIRSFSFNTISFPLNERRGAIPSTDRCIFCTSVFCILQDISYFHVLLYTRLNSVEHFFLFILLHQNFNPTIIMAVNCSNRSCCAVLS